MSAARGTGTRRSNACWTCKLRRKKCDAAKPACLACESRNITCHGYGDWPEWMDGGPDERKELRCIQKAVKDNKKRNRQSLRQTPAQNQSNGQQPLTTTNEVNEVNEATNSSTHQVEPSSHSSDHNDIDDVLVDPVSCGTPLLAPTPTSNSYFRFGYHREAELLMHYLDHVFALQFRFHSPSVAHGGRGWLLWLLTETKPLYHAALSLGALHQHSLLARTARNQRYHDTLNELNEHHNRALQELQIFLQSNYDISYTAELGRKRRLQILACGVELISFEVGYS